MATNWVVSQDSDPARRIAFESAEAAQAFNRDMTGWSLIDDDDPRWQPMVGSAGGPKSYPHMPAHD